MLPFLLLRGESLMAGYYSFIISDGSIKKELSSIQFAFSHKSVLSRNVNSVDSTVTVDLTDFTTIKDILVTSTKEITLTINGSAIPVTNFLFMEVSSLTSLTVACSDTTGSEVEIIIWGN